MRPCCSEWRSERDQAGEQLMVSSDTRALFFPSPFTMLMFLSELTADDVCCVYWQRVFFKLLKELQCPSLLQKRVYARV